MDRILAKIAVYACLAGLILALGFTVYNMIEDLWRTLSGFILIFVLVLCCATSAFTLLVASRRQIIDETADGCLVPRGPFVITQRRRWMYLFFALALSNAVAYGFWYSGGLLRILGFLQLIYILITAKKAAAHIAGNPSYIDGRRLVSRLYFDVYGREYKAKRYKFSNCIYVTLTPTSSTN